MPTNATSGGIPGNGKMPKGGGPAGMDPFRKQARGPNLTLGELDPTKLQECLDAVLNTGALLSFGRTSDGGAIGVYLTHNEVRHREWAGNEDELEAVIESLLIWARHIA